MLDSTTPELPLTYLPPEHGWQPHPQVSCHVWSDDNAKYVLGATLHEDGTLLYHDSPYDLILYFMETCKGGELLLHDAAVTMLHLIPHFEQLASAGYDIPICVSGDQNIIYAQIKQHGKRGQWRIRDTHAVLPMPLSELGAIAGMVPQEPGGDLRDYLASTCKLILQAYRGYCKIIRRQWQIGPARTSGSTAMKTWRRRINPESAHWRQRKEVDTLARTAYVGGMTFWRDNAVHTDYAKIDVNAMYASVMRDCGVPTGIAAGVLGYDPTRPGIYHVRCTCPPENPFPFVPVRTDKGVRYKRRGTFETVVPSITIEAAQERGYTFEIIEGYVWERIEYLFTEWVNECESIEMGLGGASQGYKKVVKAMRNALSGKFGQKPLAKSYTITANPTDEMTPCIGVDGWEIDNLWYTEIELIQPHIQPHWAAWITAAARNVLMEAAYAIGPELCCYGDTDSIVAPYAAIQRANLDIGAKYGQWKLAAEYKSFISLRGKTYIGQYYDGSWELKHNGIPQGAISPSEVAPLLSGETLRVVFPSLPKALDTMGGGAKTAQTIARTIGAVYNVDKWENSS